MPWGEPPSWRRFSATTMRRASLGRSSTLGDDGAMAQWTKPSDDELRALLGIPFGLTRSVRDPRQLRSPRYAELDGRQAWRFDVALNRTYFAADHESVANNYSAGVVATARRIDGRVALERRGPMRRAESARLPEVTVPHTALHGAFRVRASASESAAALLTGEVCDWLTTDGKGYHYEVVHDRVLAYGWRRYFPTGGPVRAALGLARAIERLYDPSPNEELVRHL